MIFWFLITFRSIPARAGKTPAPLGVVTSLPSPRHSVVVEGPWRSCGASVSDDLAFPGDAHDPGEKGGG